MPQIELMPHQVEAVEAFRQRQGKMLLKGDPGVGKTFVACEIMRRLWEPNPHGEVLVVCPAAVVDQWLKEIKKFFNREYPHPNIVVINYEKLLNKDVAKIVLSTDWMLIVADESHRLNNPKSKMVKQFMKLKTRYKLALSGTPFPNGLYECYSVINWLSPGLLGRTHWSFIQDHCLTHFMFKSKIIGYRDEKKLMKIIAPYIHTIDKSVLNLPPKKVIYEWVTLSDSGRKVYEGIRREMQLELQDKKITIPNIVSLIVRLRQFIDCPSVLDERMGVSSKQVALAQLLSESDQRTIVFSEFATVAKALHAQHGGWIITGDMGLKKREEQLKGFKEDKELRPLFGTSALSLGLNITESTRTIHYGIPWTDAAVSQRSGRMHRTGQTKETTEIFLLAKDTVDERMYQIVQEKGDLDRKFSKDELLKLLQ